MVKAYLHEHHISFEEISILKNLTAARDTFKKSGKTDAPIVDIDGKIIIGLDLKAIEKALGL
jgi:glutaredoxin